MFFYQDGTQIQAFVAESMEQVVGVAVLRREEVGLIQNHVNYVTVVIF